MDSVVPLGDRTYITKIYHLTVEHLLEANKLGAIPAFDLSCGK